MSTLLSSSETFTNKIAWTTSADWRLTYTSMYGLQEVREARRLLYVACTRASKHLIVSWSLQRPNVIKAKQSGSSCFIKVGHKTDQHVWTSFWCYNMILSVPSFVQSMTTKSSDHLVLLVSYTRTCCNSFRVVSLEIRWLSSFDSCIILQLVFVKIADADKFCLQDTWSWTCRSFEGWYKLAVFLVSYLADQSEMENSQREVSHWYSWLSDTYRSDSA